MNHTIKQIAAQDTYKVRQPVLRAGKPIESCIFANDDLKTTIHLGLFSNERLIGVASFLKDKNDLILESDQYQLRGMAILKAFQGKGLGRLLLEHAESELKKMQIQILWCNARETATDFYKKSAFQIIGQPFNIESAGTHYAMYKKL